MYRMAKKTSSSSLALLSSVYTPLRALYLVKPAIALFASADEVSVFHSLHLQQLGERQDFLYRMKRQGSGQWQDGQDS